MAMMRFSRYAGNPNVGVYAAVNESLGFVATDADPAFIRDAETALGIEMFMTTVAGSFVIGSLVAMNSNGLIVSELIDGKEFDLLSGHIEVGVIDDRMNAAGNNILANDSGAIVSPEMGRKAMSIIEEVLGVEAVRGTIAGHTTVGSVCRATNKGCVCGSDASDEDIALIKDVLGVEAVRSTVNHGIKYIGAGILANSKGALVGDLTTPIEMGKIEDGLVLY